MAFSLGQVAKRAAISPRLAMENMADTAPSKKPQSTTLAEYVPSDIPNKHPSVFEPITLLLGAGLAVLGAIVGLELITKIGITPNTSIIAAIITIALSRLPFAFLGGFRSLSRQNLMQTIISGATFGGANAILVPMGILWLLGEFDLVPVMMVGAFAGLVIDATIIYRVFDSRVYPATGIWPAGVAAAECIITGDRGGKRARFLGLGGAVGAGGRLLGIPMEIFGVCWIGNIWALIALGLGLLTRGYSQNLFSIDINAIYLPHGVMIGAGCVALLQITHTVLKSTKSSPASMLRNRSQHSEAGKQLGKSLGSGYLLFIGAAAGLAFLSGVYVDMSFPMLAGFVLFAASAALVSELIVGISAMHAGWFPSFATSLIFLILGMQIGFDKTALAILVGFTASTGPAFADMAYDLKAGWILRGSGKHPRYEKQGRKQQYLAELLGFAIAFIVVALLYQSYFSAGDIPPVDHVFVSTIEAGTSPSIVMQLVLWAIPGAAIQLIGGKSRQMGILFATGLLIFNPIAGWTALVAITIRVALVRIYGQKIESAMYVCAGGIIAGSALTSFGTATVKL